jgi:hypothetical protein
MTEHRIFRLMMLSQSPSPLCEHKRIPQKPAAIRQARQKLQESQRLYPCAPARSVKRYAMPKGPRNRATHRASEGSAGRAARLQHSANVGAVKITQNRTEESGEENARHS